MALFKLEKKAPRGPAGKWDVLIAEDMCKACGFCLGVCPVDVFAWRKAPNRLGWFPMYVAKEANCIGCMLCYQICPDFCIDVSAKAAVPLSRPPATPEPPYRSDGLRPVATGGRGAFLAGRGDSFTGSQTTGGTR